MKRKRDSSLRSERQKEWALFPQPVKPVLRGSRRTCSEQLRVLAKQEMIGHPGDVVADDSILGAALRKLGVGFGHCPGMLHVKIEQLGEGLHRAFAIADNCGIVIQTREQKFLERRVFRGHGCAESREAARLSPDIFNALNA